jgi:large subunit ribosomal protein L22
MPVEQAREARAFQRTTRQSPYKMRLVIDQIRGKGVNEALALLQFSKKHAAKQIEKVLHSAVANAEHHARTANASVDVDTLFVKLAVINEGPKLKRFTPAAMGRATPIIKRTSHVEIVVAERPARPKPVAKKTVASAATPTVAGTAPAKAGASKKKTSSPATAKPSKEKK